MLTQLELIQDGRYNFRMPPEKLAAYYRKMPWLETWLVREREREARWETDKNKSVMEVNQIYVSGFDLAFYYLRPIRVAPNKHRIVGSTVYYEEPIPDHKLSETIYFLQADGENAWCECDYAHPRFRRVFLFWCRREVLKEKGIIRAVAMGFSGKETAGEVLGGLGAERVRTAVYGVSYCAYTKAIIIYRAPGGMPLWDHITELLRTDDEGRKACLAAEIDAEIDAEIAATDNAVAV